MKIEISDIKIGFSDLTGEVFAGKLNKAGTMWIEKVNITNQFNTIIRQKAQYLKEIKEQPAKSVEK